MLSRAMLVISPLGVAPEVLFFLFITLFIVASSLSRNKKKLSSLILYIRLKVEGPSSWNNSCMLLRLRLIVGLPSRRPGAAVPRKELRYTEQLEAADANAGIVISKSSASMSP
ncbi:hypothetical protein IV203_009485 [Nitzschia inconspicua]|uniref:Uncharacterized protein n=1 Tax=Nitzschia inconspicua TaxID=303405 RepID=A0A9K3PK11_9STRA|nr:hypothetical protein IV203_009485 [Nitzschia inconspicua]